MTRVLVIDNYDSFTYNLVQYLGELGAEIEVVRNDQADVDALLERRPDRVVVSPGPCTPNEAGISLEVVRRFLAHEPFEDDPGHVSKDPLPHRGVGEHRERLVGRERDDVVGNDLDVVAGDAHGSGRLEECFLCERVGERRGEHVTQSVG